VCDSLQRLVTYYESEFVKYELINTSYENKLKTLESQLKTTKKGIYQTIALLLIGAVAGGIFVFLLTAKKSTLTKIWDFIKKLFK
jgi:hypothetical protein